MELTCNKFRKTLFGIFGLLIIIYCIGFYMGWGWIYLIVPFYVILLTLMVGCFIGHCIIVDEDDEECECSVEEELKNCDDDLE